MTTESDEGATEVVSPCGRATDAINKRNSIFQSFVVQRTGAAGGRRKSIVDAKTNSLNDNDVLSLFDVVADCLFGTTMIYAIPDIRKLLREHDDEVISAQELVHDFLELPCTDIKCMKVTQESLPLLEKYMKQTEIELYLNAIKLFGRELKHLAHESSIPGQQQQQQQQRRTSAIYKHLETTRDPVELHVVDDENSDKELVYAMGVHKQIKMIYITFRGSVTIRDWQIDSEVTMRSVDNPLHGVEDPLIPQSKKIGFHSGFYKYLFANKDKRQKMNKFDTILHNLKSLLDSYPGFSITVSGHSLGGALCTIFAFQLASMDDEAIPKPINCISFASPRTGNYCFAKAFQELELRNKVICVRVANHKDIITKHPDRLSVFSFFAQDALFRHVGMQLKLYPSDPSTHDSKHRPCYRLRYIRVPRTRMRQFCDDFSRSFQNTRKRTLGVCCGLCKEDYLTNHSCDEYMIRLQKAAESMQEESFHGTYEEYHKIVAEPSQELVVSSSN